MWKIIILVLIILLQLSAFILSEDAVPIEVNLPLGKIEGSIKKTYTGRPFHSFEGVPYARPPTGKYRFKEPFPAKPWVGTWKATNVHKCLQYSHFAPPGGDMILGEEDCLYLNIYTPNLKPDKLLDVIVHIHGGAFMFNYGGWQGPELLLDEDVVYVNINYRLGPLGFLSTEDDLVPGNMGLKDQTFALKWVKKNIEYFGGNPNSVTITGLSAGGASVHLHYLIPQSKGLFHRGISQSGTAICPWVLMENGLEKAKQLATIVGCSTKMDMVECLRKRPGRQLMNAVQHFMPWLYNPFSPFGVVADKWASHPFLPDHPYKLLIQKQVTDLPWISSYTGSEGLYPGSDLYAAERLETINQNWNELVPFILDFNHTVSPGLRDTVSEKIRDFYLKDEPLNQETFMKFVQLIGDRLFVADIEKANRLHSAATTSPVYTYYFTYRGAHSVSELVSRTDNNFGASHADDTGYVFKIPVNTTSNAEDTNMVKLMVKMFTSFASSGKPSVGVEWPMVPKSLSSDFEFLQIDSPTKVYANKAPLVGNRDFWESLPIQENDKLTKIKDEL